jgi:mannose-6-phosphate isomerase-like protein (cupin superfamily)
MMWNYIVPGIASYVAVGSVVHRLVLPEPEPPLSAYPAAGDHVDNPYTGEHLTIIQSGLESQGHRVLIDCHFDRGGAVPIDHVHPHQDETWAAVDGMIHVWVRGKLLALQPGEQFTVPAGTPHRAYNPSRDAGAGARVEFVPAGKGDLLPIQFLGYLGDGPRKNVVKQLLQMSLMAPRYDIYPAVLPVWIQNVLYLAIAPTARLFGYRSFYPEYSRRARERAVPRARR